MAGPIIRTEHLSRFFGTVKAVDDLSLEVPAGIVFGFLGPNGAGKTTTIHLLLGLLEPTQGQASVLGFDTRTQADEIRTRIGALLEFAGLYERMSCRRQPGLLRAHLPYACRRTAGAHQRTAHPPRSLGSPQGSGGQVEQGDETKTRGGTGALSPSSIDLPG